MLILALALAVFGLTEGETRLEPSWLPVLICPRHISTAPHALSPCLRGCQGRPSQLTAAGERSLLAKPFKSCKNRKNGKLLMVWPRVGCGRYPTAAISLSRPCQLAGA